MVRTARENRKSWYLLIIWASVAGLMYLIFGPNFLKNPFGIVFMLFLACFTGSWLFGYIHPTKWGKNRKLRKEHSYIKESPEISTLVSFQEEIVTDNTFSCPHCGALQEQETNFCTKCGQKIEYQL